MVMILFSLPALLIQVNDMHVHSILQIQGFGTQKTLRSYKDQLTKPLHENKTKNKQKPLRSKSDCL